MPKMKTHRGAAKRVKKNWFWSIKTFKSFHISLIRKQNTKQKRQLRKAKLVSKMI